MPIKNYGHKYPIIYFHAKLVLNMLYWCQFKFYIYFLKVSCNIYIILYVSISLVLVEKFRTINIYHLNKFRLIISMQYILKKINFVKIMILRLLCFLVFSSIGYDMMMKRFSNTQNESSKNMNSKNESS